MSKRSLILICLSPICRTQDSLTTADKVFNFPSSFFAKVNKQKATLENRLTPQTSTYLQRLAKREKKLQRKLSKGDLEAAQQVATANNSMPNYTTVTNNFPSTDF